MNKAANSNYGQIIEQNVSAQLNYIQQVRHYVSDKFSRCNPGELPKMLNFLRKIMGVIENCSNQVCVSLRAIGVGSSAQFFQQCQKIMISAIDLLTSQLGQDTRTNFMMHYCKLGGSDIQTTSVDPNDPAMFLDNSIESTNTAEQSVNSDQSKHAERNFTNHHDAVYREFKQTLFQARNQLMKAAPSNASVLLQEQFNPFFENEKLINLQTAKSKETSVLLEQAEASGVVVKDLCDYYGLSLQTKLKRTFGQVSKQFEIVRSRHINGIINGGCQTDPQPIVNYSNAAVSTLFTGIDCQIQTQYSEDTPISLQIKQASRKIGISEQVSEITVIQEQSKEFLKLEQPLKSYKIYNKGHKYQINELAEQSQRNSFNSQCEQNIQLSSGFQFSKQPVQNGQPFRRRLSQDLVSYRNTGLENGRQSLLETRVDLFTPITNKNKPKRIQRKSYKSKLSLHNVDKTNDVTPSFENAEIKHTLKLTTEVGRVILEQKSTNKLIQSVCREFKKHPTRKKSSQFTVIPFHVPELLRDRSTKTLVDSSQISKIRSSSQVRHKSHGGTLICVTGFGPKP